MGLSRYNKIPYKNSTKKLTPEMMDEVCRIYEKGWLLTWIGKKFKIDHSSVLYYVKRYNLKQKNGVLKKIPKKIESTYKSYKPQDVSRAKILSDVSLTKNKYQDEMTHNVHKTYEEIIKDSKKRGSTSAHDTECSHKHWVKRCSMCRGILESDVQVNSSSLRKRKDIYNALDKYVCPYQTAMTLAKLKVRQSSIFYWVYYEEAKTLSIRSKENLPEKDDPNSIVASAFTVQELCRNLLNLPETVQTHDFLIKLAKGSSDPSYLSRLLVSSIKKV